MNPHGGTTARLALALAAVLAVTSVTMAQSQVATADETDQFFLMNGLGIPYPPPVR
jgi:hypothetical protein